MFGERWRAFSASDETVRARQLEHALARFYAATAGERWHWIYIPPYAVRCIPALVFFRREKNHGMKVFALAGGGRAGSAGVSSAAGGTFTHFSSERFGALSCTLELGKALPFGDNDLRLFAATQRALSLLLAGS